MERSCAGEGGTTEMPLSSPFLAELPTSAQRRASRKPHVYALLRRWDTDGLDGIERLVLQDPGNYDRWLARDRITAEMAAHLLLFELESRKDAASDPVGNPATERARLVEILFHQRAAQGLTASEKQFLRELQRFQHWAAKRPPPILEGRSATDAHATPLKILWLEQRGRSSARSTG